MQLQQLSDINVGGIKPIDKPASKPLNESHSQKTNTFDKQLNEQKDRVKNTSLEDKNQNNQQDSKASNIEEKSVKGADEPSEHPANGLQDTDASTEQDADFPEELTQISIPLDPTIAALLLPEEGTLLPSSAPVINAVTPIDMEVVPVKQAVSILSSQLQPSIDRSLSQSAETIKNAPQAEVSKPLLAVNSGILKPIDLGFTGNDKINLQDAHYAKVMSEMSASEMFSQTSRMQQVPTTTAINNNILSNNNVNLLNPISDFSSPLSSNLNSSISAHVQSPQWSQQMTQQVTLMLKGGVQHAEIKLNPINLGPMEIKLSINDDQTSVQFVTQHAPVRDAVDSALPRLREMLEEQGLDLVNVDVSTQSEQQQANESEEDTNDITSLNESLEQGENISENIDVGIDINIKSGVSVFA